MLNEISHRLIQLFYCLQNAITEHGNEIEPLIFMVRCQIAIEKRNIQNFKLVCLTTDFIKTVANDLEFDHLNSSTKNE